jgi:ATP-dependent Clp protease ATP-binding subunit ClpB
MFFLLVFFWFVLFYSGAPPGYVGFEEGGVLTEAVRRRPYCVVLLDEWEKAHPEVGSLFLSIFDEGHITDSKGFDVSFRNSIIVATSNLGARHLANLPPTASAESARPQVFEKLLFVFFFFTNCCVR